MYNKTQTALVEYQISVTFSNFDSLEIFLHVLFIPIYLSSISPNNPSLITYFFLFLFIIFLLHLSLLHIKN